MDKQYLTLSVDNMDIQVKLDDEGVVVDVIDKDDGEIITSTWKTYDEFGVEVKQLDNA